MLTATIGSRFALAQPTFFSLRMVQPAPTASTLTFQIDSKLVDYVATGDEITTQWLKSGSPLLEAIEQIHDFFPQTLWKGDVELTPHQAMLSMNAFMLYMSAVRVSLSGHVAATFPLFRTALESACYAYVMGEDRSLETVWGDRHRGDEQRKLCRRKLSTAVSDAAKLIEATQPSPGVAAWINEAYDSAIDFGAHPNPKSIFRNVEEPQDAGDHWLVPLIGLHSSESSEGSLSLMACLDYGLVIAVVLSHCVGGERPGVAEELHRLNDLKNDLEARLFVRRSDAPVRASGS